MAENNPEDIKRAVLSRYSLHAQRRLAALQEMGGRRPAADRRYPSPTRS